MQRIAAAVEYDSADVWLAEKQRPLNSDLFSFTDNEDLASSFLVILWANVSDAPWVSRHPSVREMYGAK